MRTLLTSLLAGGMLFASHSLTAQNNFWKLTDETNLKNKSQFRQIVPQKYLTFQLNVSQMKSLLKEAPLWQTDAAEKKTVLLTLPMPDGSFQRFKIVEAPVMHPDLAKKFPEIRSYAGTGIDDPTAYLRCDFTPRGFHGMVRTALTSTVYIDPYSTADIEHYIVYYRSDFFKNTPWECSFDEVNDKKATPPPAIFDKAGDCKLRTYDLALACTGEYAQYHGGTVASALAAMNTTLTRVNGVFENDASIHMNLVANNNLLVFLNPSTDPYTNNNGSTMLGQNQTTCNNVIGSANYDIGHVFSTGGGGVAYLGCVCNNSNKAGGVTGSANPVGDPFDIDYVAHEMGHQFGANHTQNNNCNRNSATAMEPGSASTIMGYAGICPPNVQNNSDDYFHAISLQEIGNFTVGSGNSCATVSTINSAPTANAGPDYTIPKSTPFVLTGSGTDPNSGDVLKYCWEQMDNQVATMPPVSTNTGGPMFRSFKYTTSPSRYFPRLQDLVNNVSPTWEVLPSVGRTLNFRFTVRDNHVGGGCTKEDNTVITVNGTAGPFQVTAPNTAVTWQAGSTQTVTWNVAGTTAAPVSCANVDIFLSLDGGFTYPVTLATATPNDGSHPVSVPNSPTTQARVMVKANGNIFFDISNANFTISAPAFGFTLDVTPDAQTVCQPNNAQYTVNIGSAGGFSGSVSLSASGVPAGATAGFSPNPVTAPGSSTLTISGIANVAPGTYNIIVTGSGSSGSQSETIALTVLAGAPAQVTLASPSNGSTGVSQTPTLSWNAVTGATSYEVQVATDPAFSNLVVNASGVSGTTYNVTTSLAGNTQHYWRVRAVNACGNGAYSTAFTFTTGNTTCSTFPSTNVPKTISASGTPTVTSTLAIGSTGTITDINLLNLNITHSWINDLIVKLKSPVGTEITLLNQICGSQDNILTNFDDEATNPYSALPCPPTNNGFYQPFQALSAFDGQNLNGTWTLTVQDVANQDGGTLNAWSLQICYSGDATPPLSVSATGTNVSCNGGNNGTATANPTGGTGSYSYAWSNGASTQTITGLTAGTYTVTVTSGGQTATASVTITQPAALNVNATGTNASCGINNGSATASVSGGTPPYSYAWSNGGSTQTINGLAAGTYTVTATDNNGCTGSASVTISSSNSINVSATGTNTTCGNNNGSATANPSGGTPPYSFAWSNGGSTQTITGLGAGTYTVTASDSNGCTGTASVSIAASAPISVSATGTNTTCGNNNGSATANPSGGTSPYSFAWSNGGSTQTITGLGAGTYTVTATDSNGCTGSASVSIAGSAPISVSATGTNTTCGNNNGSATANPSGGTPPYSYAWSNGGSTQTITGLGAGTYTVTVTAAGGCTGTASVTIAASSAVNVSATGTNVSCNGASNGSATANPSGGTPPYSYAWSNGGSTQTITGLGAGTYTVTVTATGGCTGTASVTITQPAVLTVSVTGVNPSGGNNGSATANPSGGTSPYSYAWSNGGTTQTITDLGAGTYTVTVTDSKGCTATGSVTLTSGGSALKFEYGVLSSVTQNWQTVTLSNNYNSMVVVTTVVLPNNTTASLVSRVQNAAGNSFDVKVQIAGDEAAAAGPVAVHYIVAEEGTYTVAQHGVKFEAIKATAAQTGGWSPGWPLEARSFSNPYNNPVVVGQVMTYNDPLFSVFWSSRANNMIHPPLSNNFAAGKHIAQDNDVTTRLNETIGYMVFESGSGTIVGKRYMAGVGADIVRGLPNSSTGYAYPLSGFSAVHAAAVSSTAMDATEGAWAVMATATPLTTTTLRMWACEDQIADSERNHTHEQMAYVVIGTASSLASGPQPELGRRMADNAAIHPALLAYPNPASKTLTLEFTQTDGSTMANLLILDLLGKVVLRQEVQPDGEEDRGTYRQVNLDLDSLQPGHYTLQLTDGKVKQSIRFVKVE